MTCNTHYSPIRRESSACNGTFNHLSVGNALLRYEQSPSVCRWELSARKPYTARCFPRVNWRLVSTVDQEKVHTHTYIHQSEFTASPASPKRAWSVIGTLWRNSRRSGEDVDSSLWTCTLDPCTVSHKINTEAHWKHKWQYCIRPVLMDLPW